MIFIHKFGLLEICCFKAGQLLLSQILEVFSADLITR